MIFTNSPSSLLVYNNLQEENTQLQDIIVTSTESVGIASTVVDSYKIPPAALDQLVLQKISTINTKKQQIVTILTNNYNQYAANSGGCAIGTTTTDIAGNALNVTVVGTAATFSYFRGIIPTVGVKAEVRSDTLYSWTLPALENVDTSYNLYTSGGSYQQVISSNLGIGKTDRLVSDVSDVVGVHGSSTLLGYYYPIVDASPSCVSVSSSVTSLINEIVSIRTDIGSLVTQINSLKDRKTEKQLNLWYETISLNDSISRKNEIQTSISAMESNEQTIDSYEQSL